MAGQHPGSPGVIGLGIENAEYQGSMGSSQGGRHGVVPAQPSGSASRRQMTYEEELAYNETHLRATPDKLENANKIIDFLRERNESDPGLAEVYIKPMTEKEKEKKRKKQEKLDRKAKEEELRAEESRPQKIGESSRSTGANVGHPLHEFDRIEESDPVDQQPQAGGGLMEAVRQQGKVSGRPPQSNNKNNHCCC
ncbi:hypothetical protein BDV96DRAFT_660897 [Lophiotrema nucula]|uniref:Uncharacterized protein n=1 Tax=Lophiotrema nucula TaxID=690887 RepID=A0A6A5Z807_9PLEO|nr:hypothetical protein BDV96DRAFT_660897 [Lophiotrema nucula]